jgi:hypothetical protein
MKSLAKDENDINQLRYGRMKNQGLCVASEFYQNCPYFFTRESAVLPLVGMYRGGSAFLICSGPSFATLDKNLLKTPGIWVMTTNNASTSFRGNASVTVDDPCRFNASLWLDPTIMKFVPCSHFEKPLWDNRFLGDKGQQWALSNVKVGDCGNVVGYRRNEKFVPERFLYEDTVNWGNHKKWGGGRSVMLAALRILFLLGFRKVYLLGVDFYMSGDKKYHFNEERTPNAIRGNMSTYEKMIGWFAQLQPFFLAENFVVKNCNPESRLTAFPFIKYEDAIKEATSIIGDTTKEQTSGMYTSIEEKMAALNAGKKKIEEERAKQNLPNIAPNPAINAQKTQVIYQQPKNVESKPQEATFVVNKDMKPIGTVVTPDSTAIKVPTPADIKM